MGCDASLPPGTTSIGRAVARIAAMIAASTSGACRAVRPACSHLPITREHLCLLCWLHSFWKLLFAAMCQELSELDYQEEEALGALDTAQHEDLVGAPHHVYQPVALSHPHFLPVRPPLSFSFGSINGISLRMSRRKEWQAERAK